MESASECIDRRLSEWICATPSGSTAFSLARYPGALPPATESCPSGAEIRGASPGWFDPAGAGSQMGSHEQERSKNAGANMTNATRGMRSYKLLQVASIWPVFS